MLALLGELDMVPTSHAALLFEQYKQLAPVDQAAKPIVIIPGMDHSQFCTCPRGRRELDKAHRASDRDPPRALLSCSSACALVHALYGQATCLDPRLAASPPA